MADPYSVVLKARIARPSLDMFLATTPLPASKWSDWPNLGQGWSVDWAKELPELLAGVDAELRRKGNHRSLQRVDEPYGIHAERLEYDKSSNTFVRAELSYSESLSDIIEFLAAARGLMQFMKDDDSGFAVVYDYLQHGNTAPSRIPPGNIFAISLSPSGSHFLNQNPYVDLYETALRESVVILDQLAREAAARDNFFLNMFTRRTDRDRALSQGLIENLLPPDKE